LVFLYKHITVIYSFIQCSGHIGLRGFHHVLTDKRTQNLPIILETPSFERAGVWAKEIEVLNGLSSLDMNGEVQSSLMVSEWVDAVRAVVGTGAVVKKSAKRSSKAVRSQEDEGSESNDQ
jgi:AP endonuclease-1